MESQVVNNSDVKNLQTLSMILDTYLENCIQNTDWENKANAQREKEKLYQKILKTINQMFSRIGVAAATLAQQPQQNQQEKQLNDAQVQQQDQSNTNKNSNMETENAINGQTNSIKVEQYYGNSQAQKHQDGKLDQTNMVQVNKNQMEDESGYCQKVVINAHPFKQRLINQQQRAQQQLKQKNDHSDEDDYDPPDNSSDSDFKSSDEDYSDKKKKLIHKKKHNNYFSYNSQNLPQATRPRGRPPSFANSENGTVSIQVAPVSEQKKILEFFNQHYDPQKRNKIYVINQITKQFNYSYSSVYYLVTKQAVSEEQEYHEQVQKHKQQQQQQHRGSSQFQTQLQRQQMQQQQYYQNQFSQLNYKSEQFNNGYSRQGQSQPSSHHQSDMQKRNPSYYEQQRQQIRDNKISQNDRFAQNLLNQPNSQPYNSLNQQRRNPTNQYSQQQGNYQNSHYLPQEMSQTESDSGVLQNQAHRQQYPQAEDELFRSDHKTESQHESRRVSEQTQDLQAKQALSNQNRLGSSENRQNVYGEYHRSVSSRDTIQIQQKQE
ncbi:hypothetical protein ABPG74_001309 [Tetrahymena malaccensis]